jgi:hypothetical protein
MSKHDAPKGSSPDAVKKMKTGEESGDEGFDSAEEQHKDITNVPQEQKEITNADLMKMMSFMTKKIDKITSKVDKSLAVAKEAKDEAVAAKQAAHEAKTSTAAVEQEISDIKADLNQLKSHGVQSDGIKKKDVQDMIDQSIKDKINNTVPGNGCGKGVPNKGNSDDQEFKAKVKGFPAGTYNYEIEAAMKSIIKDTEAAGIKKAYSPGFRSNKGFILFDNAEGYKTFMRRTRDKEYAAQVDEGQVQVKVVPYQSQEQWEETKETRTLVRTIGELGGIERTDESWKTLSANHRQKEVFLGRALVGEFKESATPGEGKTFTIDLNKIDEQSKKLSLKMTGTEVHAEFWKRMKQ